MRIAVFLVVVGIGALVGVFASGGDVGLRIVMGCIGAVVGTALGGAMCGLGRRPIEKREIPGVGAKSIDIAANYWRDHGRPPR